MRVRQAESDTAVLASGEFKAKCSFCDDSWLLEGTEGVPASAGSGGEMGGLISKALAVVVVAPSATAPAATAPAAVVAKAAAKHLANNKATQRSSG